jgi:hypothetical protein
MLRAFTFECCHKNVISLSISRQAGSEPMAVDKAARLTDEQLTEEIAKLESGKTKLRVRDEQGRAVPLNDLVLPVFRREQEKRKKEQVCQRDHVR